MEKSYNLFSVRPWSKHEFCENKHLEAVNCKVYLFSYWFRWKEWLEPSFAKIQTNIVANGVDEL